MFSEVKFTPLAASHFQLEINLNQSDSEVGKSSCEKVGNVAVHVAESAKKAFIKMPKTLTADSDDEGETVEDPKKTGKPKEKAEKEGKKGKTERKEKSEGKEHTDHSEKVEKKDKKEKSEGKLHNEQSEKVEKKEKKKKAKKEKPTEEIETPTHVVLEDKTSPIEKVKTKREKKDEFALKKIKQPFGMKHRAWLVAGMASIVFFCVISRETPALVSALTPGLMDYLRVTYKSLPGDGYEKRIMQFLAAASLVLAFAATFTSEDSVMNAIPFFAFAVAIAIKCELNKSKPEKHIAAFFEPSATDLPTTIQVPQPEPDTFRGKITAFTNTAKNQIVAYVNKGKAKIAPEGITKETAQFSYAGLQTLISGAFITKTWSSNIQAVGGTIFKSNSRLLVGKYFKVITDTSQDTVRRTCLAWQYAVNPLIGALSFYSLRDGLVANPLLVLGISMANIVSLDTTTRLLKGFLWEFAEQLKYGNLTEIDMAAEKAKKAEKGEVSDVYEMKLKDHLIQFMQKCPRGAVLLGLIFGISYPLNQLMLRGTLPQAVIATLANELVVLFKPLSKAFVGTNMSLAWVIPSIVLFSFGFKNEAALSILPSLALYLGKDKIRPKSDLEAMQVELDKMKPSLEPEQVKKLQLKLDIQKAEASHIF